MPKEDHSSSHPGGGHNLNLSFKEKKIRARPMGQKKIQEEDLKPEFRLKVGRARVASRQTESQKPVLNHHLAAGNICLMIWNVSKMAHP